MRQFDIGFLGGGQLARMSIHAAQRMGLACLSLDPGTDTPASQVASAITGSLSDAANVAELFRSCERVTLENEFIPADTIRDAMGLAGRDESDILPGTSSLETTQDKLLQRRTYGKHGVPSPKAVALSEDGDDAVTKIGFPMVLKARFGGYDGKGTRNANDRAELDSLNHLWGDGGWLAEQYVQFRRELSVMVCRSAQQTICFPTVETRQSNLVCDLVLPCDADAREVAVSAVEAIDGFGLFGVEMFELESGEVQVNEIAPRPHNAGHYTLDWGGLSQFEAHIRLVMGLPLPELSGQEVCMANLLGVEGAVNLRGAVAAAMEGDAAVFVHWYGKREVRAGRKMGHLNAVGADCVQRAQAARARFLRAWAGA